MHGYINNIIRGKCAFLSRILQVQVLYVNTNYDRLYHHITIKVLRL